MTRSGISKTEPKARKRNADAIAKAAEEKRRKIEGDHNDAAADDDDIKPVIPKLEPGTGPMIKPEPGTGLHAFPYSSTFMQAHNAQTLGYLPTPTTFPGPSFSPSHTIASDEPFAYAQPMWQNSSPVFPRTTPSPLTSRHEPYKQSPSRSPPTIPADCIKKEATVELTILPSTPQSPHLEQAIQQALPLPSHEDAVFQDFCKSDLFMPPIQQNHTAPSSTRARHHGKHEKAEGPNLAAVSTNTFSDNLCQVNGGSDQPECIIIDD